MASPASSPSVPIHKTQRFEDFYRLFEDKPGVYKYQEQINDIISKNSNNLIIFYEDLLAFDSQLAEMLKKDPESLIEEAISAFKNTLKFQGAKVIDQEYFVSISTMDEKSPLTIPLRGLRAKHIDTLVSFKGILIRSSTIRPKLIDATFECLVCKAQFNVTQLTSRIKWPKFCIKKSCKARAQSDFRLISKNSTFIDWQSVTIQEIPEDLPPGRIPRAIQSVLKHDLVDIVKPGDRVNVVGIYKSTLAQSTKSINSTLFKTYIDVNLIDPEDKADEVIDLSKEDKKVIEKLSKEPRIQRKIARSIAPTIYGREDLKMACALSLFAGTRKKKPDGGYKRGDIHVLFVGDPGTGKSEILKSAIDISPRGLYTSGKGSTAVGLTAAVIKDTDTGQMNLEAGAVVLANGGIAAIDEFDKMDPQDRSALHEAMEQQSYHFDTEITTTDGQRVIMGEFIDKLMDKNKDNVIKGKDCQIMLYDDLTLYTTDFEKIYKTKVNRISRHKAPNIFYKITFTNGRHIKVTPEHPVFVFRDERLLCIPACECLNNDFIPIPNHLPNSDQSIPLYNFAYSEHPDIKELTIPDHLNTRLARILGYIITKGYSYDGSTTEISFSNINQGLIKNLRSLMYDTFDIEPTTNIREDGLITLRYISTNLYHWMLENFPEVMRVSRLRRIPSKIMASSINIAKEFLIGAFKGDGIVEARTICYRTASRGLSEDYQDLLLKLGIHSRIVQDKSNNSFKTYIRGQSLLKFFKEIIENNDYRYEKIKKIVNLIKLGKVRTPHKWERIKKVELENNEGKNYTPWVYDITVEPNHNFISQGVILHNTVSIAKAGIVATLKAQTAIIAAANPRSGRYDRYKTPTQNIHLPPSLLSRFDLIFVVIDRPDPADDARMAEFILKNSMIGDSLQEDVQTDISAPIPGDLLKKYIKHARRNSQPLLTDEAKERIKEYYLDLRGKYDSEDAIVSILARNLDALVRLSEAYAKMALRDKVLKEDVEEIIKLFRRYLEDTGYDETTGKIDMDRILVGQSRSSITKLDKLLNRLKEIFEENNWQALERKNVIEILELEEELDEKWIKDAIEELVKEGTLYEPRNNYLRFTNKEE